MINYLSDDSNFNVIIHAFFSSELLQNLQPILKQVHTAWERLYKLQNERSTEAQNLDIVLENQDTVIQQIVPWYQVGWEVFTLL